MSRLVEIDDPADPRLADYRDLRDVELRKHLEAQHGLFLAEGEKVVRRAVEAGYLARSFLMAPRWLDGLADVLARAGVDTPCYVVSEALAEQVTGFHVHRGALASLKRRPLPTVDAVLDHGRSDLALGHLVGHPGVAAPDRPMRVAVLEDFVDHANVGAVFRNAAALGVDAVLLSPACADPLYRRAVKVSMGAVLQVPWTRVLSWPDGLDELRSRGFVLAGMSLSDDSITLDELAAHPPRRLALVFGTEGWGMKPHTAARLDQLVTVPMAAGVDSMNVAASSAVAFYATRPTGGGRS